MYPEENFSKNRFFIYEELVRENFHFLIERYGFKIFNIKMLQGQYILIRYLSESVFVDLYYSSPGFELDFCLGRVGIDEQPEGNNITSSDIVLMNEYGRYARYKLYSAHSYENLVKGLPKLANLLESHGDEFLKGNFQCYEEVLLKKKRNFNQWSDDQAFKQAKKVAFTAWENKDYAKFVETLDPFVCSLSPAERKKLEYARKHI